MYCINILQIYHVAIDGARILRDPLLCSRLMREMSVAEITV